MRQAGRPELTQLNAGTVPYLLAIVVAATVGAVLAGRLPRHPVGWLLVGQARGGRAGRLRGGPDGRARPGDPAPRHGGRPGHHPRARLGRGCATRSTWTPWPARSWPWSTRPWPRPGRRCGSGRRRPAGG